MTADVNAPQVGDVFRTFHGAHSIVVLFVGDEGSVVYRYTESPEVYLKSAEQFARHYRAAPEPLITEPVTLYERRVAGESWIFIADRPTGEYNTGRCITLFPDGTWQSGMRA